MATYDEQGFIVGLEPEEVLVFGSNLAGRHGKGAALQARKQFGARYGVGEGLTGQCYAFPTLDENLQKLPWERLVKARGTFYDCAKDLPGLTFYLTKVGCGLAGYQEDQIAALFWSMPDNVVKPAGWL